MSVWRNWTTHNMIAHPVGELLHLFSVLLQKLSDLIHDSTVPEHEPGEGRG